jgi:GrpB-like predicted nucleotidyltransferase (UPF0157 family)
MGSSNWYDCVLFRDYLRRHRDARTAYAALKESLAEEHLSDRKSYTQGKEEFIRSVIKLARDELAT